MSGVFFLGITLLNFFYKVCPPPANSTFEPFEYSNFNLTFKGPIPSLFNVTLVGKAYKKANLIIDLQSHMQITLVQLQLDDENLMLMIDDVEYERYPLPFNFNQTVGIQLLNDGDLIHFYYSTRPNQVLFTRLASFGHYHRCSTTGYKFLNISGGLEVDEIKIYECDPERIK